MPVAVGAAAKEPAATARSQRATASRCSAKSERTGAGQGTPEAAAPPGSSRSARRAAVGRSPGAGLRQAATTSRSSSGTADRSASPREMRKMTEASSWSSNGPRPETA
ncbi:hypothetical protein [Streptomyces alfalfae]|uniref:hypothetical protein n=1 Tax=Streptomyces alfalfae TaxID=1642299 RepID=UPI001E4D0EAB|nr:hypothetical protein [Streptomyces alfalfae]